MPIQCALWIVLILPMPTGIAQDTAPSAEAKPPSENEPLLLIPNPTNAPIVQRPRVPDSTLSEELERLKQEQESLRSVLTQTPADSSGPANPHADSARLLRLQLDQLTAELAHRQSRSKAAAAEDKLEVRSTVHGSGLGKSHALVSRLTADPVGAAGALKKSDGDGKPVDPLALGQVLLHMEDYEGAIQAFRGIEFSRLRSDDRAYAQYLLASALRAAGRSAEAVPLYREVANSRADVMIADCARWQLALLQWQQELEGQLGALRQRRKSLESAASAKSFMNLDKRQEGAKENP